MNELRVKKSYGHHKKIRNYQEILRAILELRTKSPKAKWL